MKCFKDLEMMMEIQTDMGTQRRNTDVYGLIFTLCARVH